MPRTFTLDTNCIIAVDESRPEAAAILELARTHQTGRASVGLVAISASERQHLNLQKAIAMGLSVPMVLVNPLF